MVAQIPASTDRQWRQQQGPRYLLQFTAGGVKLTAKDYARASKADGLAADREVRQNADMLMQELTPTKRGQIRDMSQKSRARMPWVFSAIDYTKMFERGEQSAFVTLTYPMEWQRLAPDATTFKKHVNALRARDRAAWGAEWAGIWKMEFQRRGAPHLHVGSTMPEGRRRAPLSADDRVHLDGDLSRPESIEPCQLDACERSEHDENCLGCHEGAHTGLFEYREWLSRVWSYVIFKTTPDAPSPWSIEGWSEERAKHERSGTRVDTDEAERGVDPKRLAIYFAKHGLFAEKEYQNTVPQLWRDKPGARFWGYWVVRPVVVSKETHESLIISIVRHLRALSDRGSYSRREHHVKGGHNPRTGEIWEPRKRKRPVNRRVKRWRNRMGYGYQLFNDVSPVAADIARIIGAAGFHLERTSGEPDYSAGDFFESPDVPARLAHEQLATSHDDRLALWPLGRHDDRSSAGSLPVGQGDQLHVNPGLFAV